MILYTCFLFLSAEDWLKPNVVIEAFEARAARMSVAVAQNISKFSNPEEGKYFDMLFESQALLTCLCSLFLDWRVIGDHKCFNFLVRTCSFTNRLNMQSCYKIANFFFFFVSFVHIGDTV